MGYQWLMVVNELHINGGKVAWIMMSISSLCQPGSIHGVAGLDFFYENQKFLYTPA